MNWMTFILAALKGIVLIKTLEIISTSTEVSKLQSCELGIALDLISVDKSSVCKEDGLRDDATTVHGLGISLFIFHIILICCWLLKHLVNNKKVEIGLHSFNLLCAVIFSIAVIVIYTDVLRVKTTQKSPDYDQLRRNMKQSLTQNYKSDNLSSIHVKSNNWNKFFISYDCCAVDQVMGTSNDFDNTPWCQTLGSCQATASQIPKTCCNHVTEYDYGSAPSGCHSSVNAGTYKSNCINAIKKLALGNTDRPAVSMMLSSMLIVGVTELAEVVFVSIAIGFAIKCPERISPVHV